MGLVALVLLTSSLTLANSLHWNCAGYYCYHLWQEKLDWDTAYRTCTSNGGDLISYEHRTYVTQWLPAGVNEVWTALRVLNHRFHWLKNNSPEYAKIGASEWSVNHPQPSKDCATANRTFFYTSADCNKNATAVCVIRKQSLQDRPQPQDDLTRNHIHDITLNAGGYSVRNGHVEVDYGDLNKKNLQLVCNVSYKGRVQYTWIKDGVHIPHNSSKLLLAVVKDPAKTQSTGDMFQKQGTYQCQVKLPNNWKSFTSKALLVTFHGILNGIVITRTRNSILIKEHMNKMVESIKDVLVKKHSFQSRDVSVSWDPLYHILKRDGFEYRSSVYMYSPTFTKYPQTTLSKILSDVSDNFVNSSVTVTWATHCGRTELWVNGIRTEWGPSWIGGDSVKRLGGEAFCVRADNAVDRMTGRCQSDFVNGAYLLRLPQNCSRPWIPEVESREGCYPGYQKLGNSSFCYQLTSEGSWDEALVPCFNHWPIEELTNVNLTTLINAIMNWKKLIGGSSARAEIWLPLRRPTLYGPLLYYFPKHGNISIEEIEDYLNISIDWTHAGLLAEECAVLTGGNQLKLSECSAIKRPAFCLYDAAVSASTLVENLCPAPWKGSRIVDGQLVCYQVVRTNQSVTWYQASDLCKKEVTLDGNLKVNGSLATFEAAWKVRLFQEHFKSIEAWTGLQWSESHRKFCWNAESIASGECQFDYFNWKHDTDFNGGICGALNSNDQMIAVPKTSQLDHTVCQAIFRLKSIEDIEIVADDFWIGIQAKKSRWFTTTQKQSKITCLGETGRLVPSPLQGLPHYFKWNKSETVNCQGWLGWPRKFTKSNIVFPTNSSRFTFLLTLKLVGERLSSSQYERTCYDTYRARKWNVHSINVLSHLNKTFENMEKELGSEVDVDADPVRFQTSEKELEFLLRLHITPQEPFVREQTLLEFFQRRIDEKGSNNSKYYLTDLRSIRFCPAETMNGIQWPSVSIGVVAEPVDMCLSPDGSLVLRKCSGNVEIGAFWEPPYTSKGEPVESCVEIGLTARTLKTLFQDVQNHIKTCSEALDKVAQLSQTWRSTVGELRQAARILDIIVRSPYSFSVEDFYNASRILAAVHNSSASNLMDAQAVPMLSNSLLKTVETLAAEVKLEDDQSAIFQERNLVTKVLDVRGYHADVVGYAAEVENDGTIINPSEIMNSMSAEMIQSKDVAVVLPMAEIRQMMEYTGELRLAFTVLPDGNLLDARKNKSVLDQGEMKFGYSIQSPVIVAQVGNRSIGNLKDPVQIFFRPLSNVPSHKEPLCAFWDPEIFSNYGGWSTSGCRLIRQFNGTFLCQCNHLTPLALLIPYSLDTYDDTNGKVLNFISTIGCSLSMFGLSLVIITFLLFPKWRKSLGNKILFNLSLALFFFYAAFLLADQMAFDIRLCKAISAALHYFLLGSFLWMSIEAVYQYLVYVQVVNIRSHVSGFMRKAAPVAWGAPVVPVIGLLVYDSTLYVAELGHCWMALSAFYPTVLGPISILLCMNVLVYLCIIKSVTCSRVYLRNNQGNSNSWYQLRMAICVFFLLGLTWIFGFLAVGNASLAFAYLFCVFSSFQGFCIFAFYVLRERSAIKLWSEFLGIFHNLKLVSNHNSHSTRTSDKFYNTKVGM